MSASALTGESRPGKMCIELNKKTWENIRNIIDHNLKKDYQIYIIFGSSIYDTTGYWMTV